MSSADWPAPWVRAKLAYEPRDLGLFEAALTHRSASGNVMCFDVCRELTSHYLTQEPAEVVIENQIVASVTTFGILLMFWVIGWSAEYAGAPWGRILSHISLLEHFDSFAKGVFDTKDVLYYVNFTIVALFLTLRALEARRWKG